MISLRPGPHSPNLGPKVYSKIPNHRYGYSIHKQGLGFYRVVAWFSLPDGTRALQCHTKLGFWNARDQGELSIHDLVMQYWPTSETLTGEVAAQIRKRNI